MRKPIIAGNWKMNMTPSQAKELVTDLIPLVKDAACDVVVCPPYVDIALVAELVQGTNIQVGAQNIHWAEKGAFTGEISAAMLKEAGAAYAIIGHSERRQYFGETDATVNSRTKAALAAGIVPIICVGESLEQREKGETDAVVSGQVKADLADIPGEAVAGLVIAYEPIWAIGTGKTATDEQANETIGLIRETIASLYGQAVADQVRIQYGGSMNPKNAAELLAQPDIDGGLIGGAALKPEQFVDIINAANQE